MLTLKKINKALKDKHLNVSLVIVKDKGRFILTVDNKLHMRLTCKSVTQQSLQAWLDEVALVYLFAPYGDFK